MQPIKANCNLEITQEKYFHQRKRTAVPGTTMRYIWSAAYNSNHSCSRKDKPMMGTNEEETSRENRAQPLTED